MLYNVGLEFFERLEVFKMCEGFRASSELVINLELATKEVKRVEAL